MALYKTLRPASPPHPLKDKKRPGGRSLRGASYQPATRYFSTVQVSRSKQAGVSLKTAIAAADLLDWAEANARDSSIDAMAAHLSGWLAAQDPERQGLFWANWPAVDEQACAIVRDMAGQRALLADAGDPQRFDHYTPACYERLTCAVEQYLEKD